MTEYFTEALVIDKKINGELNGLVILYTKNLGKVPVKAKSIKKITSKLNGHLEPFNFIVGRLIEKNGLLGDRQNFQIIDALSISNNANLKKDALVFCRAIKLLRFIESMTLDFQPDASFYMTIKKILEHFSEYQDRQPAIYSYLLKILGFDSQFASCAVCRNSDVKYFQISDHIFLCGNHSLKTGENELILIK